MQDFLERYADRMMPEPNSGCLIWFGAQAGGGYGHGYRDGRHFYAHREAFKCEHGDDALPDNLDCLHRCDFPPCCNAEHLFSGTAKDNGQDMVRKGRATQRGCGGEAHNMAKLTEDKVRAIRASSATGIALALEYNVTTATISSIRLRRTWPHVE